MTLDLILVYTAIHWVEITISKKLENIQDIQDLASVSMYVQPTESWIFILENICYFVKSILTHMG